MNKHKNLFLILVFIILLFPVPLIAQTASLPFGGQIILSIPCLCSFSWLLQLKPASPTLPPQVIYVPGVSTLYQYGQVFRSGPHVLGTTMGAYACVIAIPVPPFCLPVSVAPLIRMVGTSY